METEKQRIEAVINSLKTAAAEAHERQRLRFEADEQDRLAEAKPKRRRRVPETYARSIIELAQLFGCSRRTIHNHQNAPWHPQKTALGWPVSAVRTQYIMRKILNPWKYETWGNA